MEEGSNEYGGLQDFINEEMEDVVLQSFISAVLNSSGLIWGKNH